MAESFIARSSNTGKGSESSIPPLDSPDHATLTTEKTDVEQQVQVTDEQASPRDIHGIKWVLVVAAILSSTFLFALDNTIVADVQPAIVNDFGAIDSLSWISVGFLMGAASLNLVWGKVYSHFNAKWAYIACVVLFEAGSALCGAAPGMNAMIVGRVFGGVGGNGMYVGIMALLSFTTTIQERPLYISLNGLTWGIGTVLGPVVGGAFTDSAAGWRWSFYINLVIGAIFAPVYIFMLPSKDPRPGVSFMARAKEMDYIGGSLTVGAFVSGVMAISFGGVTYPWRSGKIIGLFVCSGGLFIILGIQQVFTVFTTKEQRTVPIEFFRSRTMLILFATMSAGGTATFVPIYMIPTFFQFTRADTALDAGVRLLPFIILMIVAIILNGGALTKFGYYMPWYAVGGALVVIGGALMCTVSTSTSVASIYGYSVILGVGCGLYSQASFSVAQASVPANLGPTAAGFIACGQVAGVTIALAIANAVFLNGAQKSIQAILPGTPVATIQQAISGVGSSFVGSLDPVQRAQVLAAIVASLSKTYILVVTAGSITVILSLFMKREKLFITAAAGG